jgi:hypothetical protein
MASYIAPSTRNITRLFRTATAEQIADGAAWYAEANELATTWAERFNLSVETVAGVIAALSPLMSWAANVGLAERFLVAGGLEEGYLKANLAKARAILAGADPIATLGGLKVTNFYLGIVSRGAEGVCVDRHAYSLAVNTRFPDGTIPSLSPKRYAEVADTYRNAAAILRREGHDVTAAQVQSVTWVLWRQKFWAVGAWDRKTEALAA